MGTALRRLLLVALAALAGFGPAACGDSDDPERSDGGPAPSESSASAAESMEHVHGLGVTDGTLFIATHTGLWTAREGQTETRRFGQSRQDIMGFSVVGEDHFVGSGHPDPSQDQPPNLGLIESRDGGRTWKSISLLGEADFHVLETSGERVFGFDGTQGRVMVSSDGGRSWQQRTPPAGVFALAVNPTDSDRVVASTEQGLFASTDAAKGWRPVNDRLAGLLAWPSVNELYLVDAQGQVQVSRDGGVQWQVVGSIDGEPAAFIADGQDLYAALADGQVKRSTDGGRSWTVRARP
jgi:photosystem II stability/assembly factor-like uncharacterized protein